MIQKNSDEKFETLEFFFKTSNAAKIPLDGKRPTFRGIAS
jgi:hypothetical protein